MIIILLLGLVCQQGDTLVFKKEDRDFERIVLGEKIQQTDGSDVKIVKKAKVSDQGKYCLAYEAQQGCENDEVQKSKITFYDENKNKLWEEEENGTRHISYELSNVYDDRLFIVVTLDQYYRNPALFLINNKEKKEIIKPGDWQRLIKYEISSNRRYLLLHTRNPYTGRSWDYIYFVDLKTMEHWDYLFPTCISCKRTVIDLKVNDLGESEVIHKDEHRIFSKDGKMVDLFLKFE